MAGCRWCLSMVLRLPLPLSYQPAADPSHCEILLHAGGSALSTLCFQPGTRKHVPLVVHSSQGSLYEVRRVRG